MAHRIYLDNNATTELDPRVAAVMIQDIEEALPANPSSVHFFGQQAKNKLTKARSILASHLKASPQEILFTSGGTESLNFLIRGFAASSKPTHILSSSIEHSCIEKTLVSLQQDGCDVTFLPVTHEGNVSIKLIEQSITKNTKLLVFSAVNGETGVKQNIEELAEVALRYNIPLIIDGVALLGKEPFQIPKGVTGMAFSAHKFHGPKGVGFVFLRSHAKIPPLLTGGGQERGLRSGTENLTGILGLAKAIEILQEELPLATKRMEELRDYFEQELMQQLPLVQVNGSSKRICNLSNLAFPNVDAETLLIQLDLYGIAASHGSACSSGALEPSRILTQMGYPPDRTKSSVRFSLSRNTTKEELDRTIYLLTQLIPQLSNPSNS